MSGYKGPVSERGWKGGEDLGALSGTSRPRGWWKVSVWEEIVLGVGVRDVGIEWARALRFGK